MSGTPHQSGDHGCIDNCRRGDSRACRELVDRQQPEILRTAFLLTGDGRQATDLALAAFEATLAMLPGIEDEDDLRLSLLASLASSFLVDGPVEGTVESSIPVVATTGRYQVDSERSRTLQALLRLEPAERAALVLHRFNALSEDTAGRSAGLKPADADRVLTAADQRLRLAVDWPEGEPLRILLAEASIDAPRVNLWPDLEELVQRLQQRERQRSRLIMGAAFAVAAVFLIGGLAMLIGFNRSNGEETSVAAAPTLTPPPARSNPTPGQTVLTPVPERIANVPSAMLASDGAQLAIYHPDSGEQFWTADASEAAALSPDGSWFYSARVLRDEKELRVSVTGTTTGPDGPGWETEILKLEGLTNPQLLAFTVDIAVSDSFVYAAYRAWQVPGPIMIVTMDRETGMIIREQPHAFSGPITGQIGLHVTPNDTELYLLIVAQWQEYVGQVDYFRFSLPRLIVKQRAQPVGGDPDASFLFWVSAVLPDGSGLYRVTYSGESTSAIVRFFNFENANIEEISLPFNLRHDETTLPLETVASHDGKWLYVLAPSTGELAIVDLETRQLDRLIPLETGSFAPEFPGPVTSSTPVRPGGQFLQISDDGLRLYAAGISYDRSFAVTNGVWVIDTSSWRVTEHWFQDRPVAALVLAGETLYIQSEVIQSQSTLTTVNPLPVSAIDTVSGELIAPVQPPLTWNIHIASLADLFRQQYGMSPLIDQIQLIDNRSFTSLARLEITVAPVAVAVGETVSINLHFVDPATNQPVEQDAPGVRYNPPDTMTLLFSAEGKNDVLVLPGQVAYGHYRGDVQLDGAGSWDLDVFMQGGLTTDSPVRRFEAVTVIPSLTALDECAPVITDTDTSRTPTRGECSFQ